MLNCDSIVNTSENNFNLKSDQDYLLYTHKKKIAKRYLPIIEILDNFSIKMHQSAKRVAEFIYRICHAKKFNAVQLTQEWIAKQLCYTRQTINTALKFLEEKGIVKILRASNYKEAHQYQFVTTALKNNLESLPDNPYVQKNLDTMSNSFTQSNETPSLYKDNNNNHSYYNEFINYTNTRTRSLDEKNTMIQSQEPHIDKPKENKINLINHVIATVPRTEEEKQVGISKMDEIKKLLKMGGRIPSKKPENDNNDDKPKENEDIPALKDCQDIDLLDHYSKKLSQLGRHSEALEFNAESCRLKAIKKVGTIDLKSKVPSNYSPWCDNLSGAQPARIEPKQKPDYTKPEELPKTMRQKLRMIAINCGGRNKEKNIDELCAQMEFSICGQLEHPDVKFGNNPLDHAFNRVTKLVKEGSWERPNGYRDLQVNRAREVEQSHAEQKEIEIHQSKHGGIPEMISGLFKPMK